MIRPDEHLDDDYEYLHKNKCLQGNQAGPGQPGLGKY